MNMGMSTEEFLRFLALFVRRTKATQVDLVQTKVILFRLNMPNSDVLEFVMNLDMNMQSLFQSCSMPDQIVYMPLANRVYANEFTLWALNFGYCPLELEKHPFSQRLSSKLRLLGTILPKLFILVNS